MHEKAISSSDYNPILKHQQSLLENEAFEKLQRNLTEDKLDFDRNLLFNDSVDAELKIYEICD